MLDTYNKMTERTNSRTYNPPIPEEVKEAFTIGKKVSTKNLR